MGESVCSKGAYFRELTVTNTRHGWQNGTRCMNIVKVLWCHSNLVLLVFEGSNPTCTCFCSENVFVTLYNHQPWLLVNMQGSLYCNKVHLQFIVLWFLWGATTIGAGRAVTPLLFDGSKLKVQINNDRMANYSIQYQYSLRQNDLSRLSVYKIISGGSRRGSMGSMEPPI